MVGTTDFLIHNTMLHLDPLTHHQASIEHIKTIQLHCQKCDICFISFLILFKDNEEINIIHLVNALHAVNE